METNAITIANSDASIALLGATSGAVSGIAVGIIIVFALIALAITVVQIIGMWRTCSKLGGRGWSQIIPVYSAYEMSTAAGCESVMCIAYTVLEAIVIAGSLAGRSNDFISGLASVCLLGCVVIGILVANQVATRFGRGKGFVVGMVLLPVVFYGILGMGSTEPVDTEADDELGD